MFKITTLDHLALPITDPDRSLAFYKESLGLCVVRLDPFASLRVNDDTIVDLFPQRLRPHVCFVVDAPSDDIRAHLARLGIAIAHADPKNFGARGIGSSFYIADPDGNTIELKTYAEEAS